MSNLQDIATVAKGFIEYRQKVAAVTANDRTSRIPSKRQVQDESLTERERREYPPHKPSPRRKVGA